jgi:hypothetical protein
VFKVKAMLSPEFKARPVKLACMYTFPPVTDAPGMAPRVTWLPFVEATPVEPLAARTIAVTDVPEIVVRHITSPEASWMYTPEVRPVADVSVPVWVVPPALLVPVGAVAHVVDAGFVVESVIATSATVCPDELVMVPVTETVSFVVVVVA